VTFLILMKGESDNLRQPVACDYWEVFLPGVVAPPPDEARGGGRLVCRAAQSTASIET
jgi:hypothetical protein